MNKFTSMEETLLTLALDQQIRQEKHEVRRIESVGKSSLFTERYFDDIQKELLQKIKNHTTKNK
tara:strand:- start:1212 stop:1403 length:192 start_codon:yes stop_codon:yes gene_type:complete